MSLQREVDQLNELEYVHGELLANVWYSDFILRINPVRVAITAVPPFAHCLSVLRVCICRRRRILVWFLGSST